MRFDFDKRKSQRLRSNPRRGIGFEEAQEIFSHPYYLGQRSDLPEQYRAIGWVDDKLCTVIFEVREDAQRPGNARREKSGNAGAHKAFASFAAGKTTIRATLFFTIMNWTVRLSFRRLRAGS